VKNTWPIPPWLDAEFLYRINYGPAFERDVIIAQQSLHMAFTQPNERQRLTLLDRETACELHRALFKYSTRKRLFCIDWNNHEEATAGDLEGDHRRRTPFDYPHDIDEVEPLMWCEEFTVKYVWTERYPSELLGSSRPPMVAVAKEMINMVNVFETLASYHPTGMPSMPLSTYLRDNATDLCRETVVSADIVFANQGYLHDLYRIVIARRPPEDDWNAALDESEISARNIIAASTTFPGSDSLRLGRLPVDPNALQGLYGSLDDMNARFICSGPFKLELTEYPSRHLTLSSDGKIMLYLEKEFKGPGFPGSTTLMRYKAHTLGSYDITTVFIFC
jgi:hypothetical protein